MALDDSFNRCIVNTVMALTGSCVVTFLASFLLRHNEFCMVDIQNATLAGGVAIGSCADLPIGPGVSLAIGCFAGLISTLGFSRMQSMVERVFGVHDTCGILNLHGMPAVIGGISAVIATASFKASDFNVNALSRTYPSVLNSGRSFGAQAGYQLAFLAITLCIALISGGLVGSMLQYLSPSSVFFSDEESWEVPTLEKPYYFDIRGEVEHGSGNNANVGFADFEKRIAALEESMAKK